MFILTYWFLIFCQWLWSFKIVATFSYCVNRDRYFNDHYYHHNKMISVVEIYEINDNGDEKFRRRFEIPNGMRFGKLYSTFTGMYPFHVVDVCSSGKIYIHIGSKNQAYRSLSDDQIDHWKTMALKSYHYN